MAGNVAVKLSGTSGRAAAVMQFSKDNSMPCFSSSYIAALSATLSAMQCYA